MALTIDHCPGAIKASHEIEAIARTGAVVSRALREAVLAARPGVTTARVERVVRESLENAGATALFLGYARGDAPPFPGAACISVNDEVVHGVPGDRVLIAGDAVTIDVGARLDGSVRDAATTMLVGCDESCGREMFAARRAMIEELRRSLDACIAGIAPGVAWSRLAAGLESRAGERGLGIVAEYIGHGIGRELHEWPRVPAYTTGFRGEDFILETGMVLAIEPIVAISPDGGVWGEGEGLRDRPKNAVAVRSLEDGWTVVTRSGAVAAHEERTVAVTDDGCRILTPLELAGA